MRRIAIVSAACLAATAHAQLLVGNDDVTGDVHDNAWNVNVNNGTSSLLWQNFAVWGMAYDGRTNTVFANHDSALGSGPLNSGAPTNLVTVHDDTGDEILMSGLAFARGQLFGVTNVLDEAFYSIDPQTGLAEMVLNYFDFDFDFGGFAYNPQDGLFYVTDDDSTPELGLRSVDLFGDGTIAFVADYPEGELDIDGLAIGNGVAYLVEDEPGPSIHPFDLATGEYLDPIESPMHTTEVLAGAAWVPAPGALAVLALGGVALAHRRRR